MCEIFHANSRACAYVWVIHGGAKSVIQKGLITGACVLMTWEAAAKYEVILRVTLVSTNAQDHMGWGRGKEVKMRRNASSEGIVNQKDDKREFVLNLNNLRGDFLITHSRHASMMHLAYYTPHNLSDQSGPRCIRITASTLNTDLFSIM